MRTDKAGIEFQNFIENLLGIKCYKRKRDQLEHGESPHPLGFEMKYNDKGNEIGCWIEVAEKRDRQNKYWIIADWITNNREFFLIHGNKDVIWIFSKKTLLILAKERPLKIIDGETSIGFNLSPTKCNHFCNWKWQDGKIININEDLIWKVVERLKDEYPNILTFWEIKESKEK